MKHADTLKLDLTNTCNAHCFFCPYHGMNGEISEQGKRNGPIQQLEIKDVLNIMEDLKGKIIRCKLSGSGEATLHPNFREIVHIIRQSVISIKLITNGITLEHHAPFINEQIDDLAVSIHGDSETHDRIVGLRGAYRRAISGLQSLNELQGGRLNKIQLSFIINKDNLDTVEYMMKISQEINIPVVFYFDFNPRDHGEIDIDHLIKIVQKIEEKGFYISPSLSESEIKRFFLDENYVFSPHNCTHVSKEIEVMATGDVYVCQSKVWGNIYQLGILDIIEGRARREFIETIDHEARSVEGLCPQRCDRCCYQHPLILPLKPQTT